MAKKKSAPAVKAPTELKFCFIKSQQYRNVPVNGVFGGITPHHQIHMNLFTEHNAMPTAVYNRVEGHEGNGVFLGPEILEKREGDSAVVRELEVGLIFNMETAVAMRTWLDDKIRQFEAERAVKQ